MYVSHNLKHYTIYTNCQSHFGFVWLRTPDIASVGMQQLRNNNIRLIIITNNYYATRDYKIIVCFEVTSFWD